MIGLLSDDLIHMNLRPDLLSFCAEVKSLKRLLHIRSELIYTADDRYLRLARECILKNASQFRVSEVNVVVVLGAYLLSLTQLVDDIRESKKRLIYVATLTKSLPLSFRLLRSFRPSKVY